LHLDGSFLQCRPVKRCQTRQIHGLLLDQEQVLIEPQASSPPQQQTGSVNPWQATAVQQPLCCLQPESRDPGRNVHQALSSFLHRQVQYRCPQPVQPRPEKVNNCPPNKVPPPRPAVGLRPSVDAKGSGPPGYRQEGSVPCRKAEAAAISILIVWHTLFPQHPFHNSFSPFSFQSKSVYSQ